MATTPRGSFSNANRHMQEEETLRLTSVGVDIGSSTSHLVFSRLELTLEGSRYRVTRREVLNESDILLTPYKDDTRIDVDALEAFINAQYKKAKIKRDEVDTGARLLAFDRDGALVRIEDAGRKHAGWAGFTVELGQKILQDDSRKMVAGMVDKLFAMLKRESITEETKALLRLSPLTYRGEI